MKHFDFQSLAASKLKVVKLSNGRCRVSDQTVSGSRLDSLAGNASLCLCES